MCWMVALWQKGSAFNIELFLIVWPKMKRKSRVKLFIMFHQHPQGPFSLPPTPNMYWSVQQTEVGCFATENCRFQNMLLSILLSLSQTLTLLKQVILLQENYGDAEKQPECWPSKKPGFFLAVQCRVWFCVSTCCSLFFVIFFVYIFLCFLPLFVLLF